MVLKGSWMTDNTLLSAPKLSYLHPLCFKTSDPGLYFVILTYFAKDKNRHELFLPFTKQF